jgi:hypothetical protein
MERPDISKSALSVPSLEPSIVVVPGSQLVTCHFFFIDSITNDISREARHADFPNLVNKRLSYGI